MQNMNRKGIGNIIAIMVLTLLTIVATYSMYLYVHKILTDSEAQLAPQFNCLQMQTSLPAELISACYDSQKKEIQVRLKKRLSNYDVPQIDFISYSESGKTEKWSCGLSCSECVLPSIENTKTLYFLPEETPNKLDIFYGECKIDSITVSNC